MRAGPYELLEVIGRGGMGTVYRSRHPETGEVVAVKVLGPAHPSVRSLRRFGLRV